MGDFVEFENGQFGQITEVSVQNTTLHTFDGVDVIVPNSSLVSDKVTNWTKKDPYLRLHVPFGVAYGTDQDELSKIIIDVAKKVPATITGIPGFPEPEIWLVGFGDSSLNFELIVWVNIRRSGSRSSLRASFLGEIEKALKANKIQIPFPQRDLHLKSVAENIQWKV